jgi:hypothetical protein
MTTVSNNICYQMAQVIDSKMVSNFKEAFNFTTQLDSKSSKPVVTTN